MFYLYYFFKYINQLNQGDIYDFPLHVVVLRIIIHQFEIFIDTFLSCFYFVKSYKTGIIYSLAILIFYNFLGIIFLFIDIVKFHNRDNVDFINLCE